MNNKSFNKWLPVTVISHIFISVKVNLKITIKYYQKNDYVIAIG